MRLMLGHTGEPSLLVSVDDRYKPTHFDFHVINGAWEGVFTNGHITVFGAIDGGWSSLDVTHILTEDQDRLRGEDRQDFQTVFNNFHNIEYVGPVWGKVVFDDIDDDIPF